MSSRDRSRSSHRYRSSPRLADLCLHNDGTSIASEVVEEPTTIISVFSLLFAYENYLGSLAPKMLELMTEAIIMEKRCVNSSNRLLDDKDHCIAFETISEKLKGFLRADLVEATERSAIELTIEKMGVLVQEANARKNPTANRITAMQTSSMASPTESHDRSAIASKLLLALKEQGRNDISAAELAHFVDQYIQLANAKQFEIHGSKTTTANLDRVQPNRKYDEDACVSAADLLHTENRNEMVANGDWKTNKPVLSVAAELGEPTTLSDSNLRTLIKHFSILSDMEKQEVIVNVRELESNDPGRMERLRSEMQVADFLNFKFGASKMQGDDNKKLK